MELGEQYVLYALGELEPDEAAEVEIQLKNNPELMAEIEKIRRADGLLSSVFALNDRASFASPAEENTCKSVSELSTDKQIASNPGENDIRDLDEQYVLYALGELEPNEAAEVEEQLKKRPELVAQVEKVRCTDKLLADVFALNNREPRTHEEHKKVGIDKAISVFSDTSDTVVHVENTFRSSRRVGLPNLRKVLLAMSALILIAIGGTVLFNPFGRSNTTTVAQNTTENKGDVSNPVDPIAQDDNQNNSAGSVYYNVPSGSNDKGGEEQSTPADSGTSANATKPRAYYCYHLPDRPESYARILKAAMKDQPEFLQSKVSKEELSQWLDYFGVGKTHVKDSPLFYTPEQDERFKSAVERFVDLVEKPELRKSDAYGKILDWLSTSVNEGDIARCEFKNLVERVQSLNCNK